ncbi:MAG TPA: hypothetical protein VKY74_05590 [Chloroflexia bacterium]|nr:hypothetical protein [Chloroflexia bacterium]
MENEPEHRPAAPRARTQHDPVTGSSARAAESINLPPAVAYAASLLDPADIQGRGNASVRAAVLQRVQQTYGNRAVQRHLTRLDTAESSTRARPDPQPVLQRDVPGSTPAGTTATLDRPPENAPAVANPTENYVVPFDHQPRSLPGEEVLFNDVFNHADPTLFQLVFTGAGGKFDSATGAASKTIAGLNSGNLPFFVDAAWDGKSAVTVKLEVQRLADHATVLTYNWTFGKKENIPTTITQQETEGERDLPSIYSYKVGPDLKADGKSDYVHETILETFGVNTCNITLADLKPAFRTAHPEITNDAQLTTFFFGGSGSNGTFTVDADDKIFDQHGGGMPDKAVFEAALITMKEIHVDLPQTYTAKPGTPLGKYTIRRILKTDGSKKLKKMKS